MGEPPAANGMGDGMRALGAVLERQGVDLTGWILEEASAVSADGRVIAGTGINPDGDTEAWIADVGELPPPPQHVPALSVFAAFATVSLLTGVGFWRLRDRSG